MGEGDDGLLRIADFELFRQGAVAELTTDFGGLKTVAVVGKLQPVTFPCLFFMRSIVTPLRYSS